MQKTSDELIKQVLESKKKENQLKKQAEIAIAYNEKLSLIKKEQQRLLRKAKTIPPSYIYPEVKNEASNEVTSEVFRVK